MAAEGVFPKSPGDIFYSSEANDFNTDIAVNTAAKHAESHTVVSHSDTTGTGAELDELTDGSSTTLHTHAGLSGTSYLSIPPVAFTTTNPDTDSVHFLNDAQEFQADADSRIFYAPVQLPHGAVVTGCIVYGSVAINAWYLMRETLAGTSSSQMATAGLNTEDTSITNATIANDTHKYWIRVAIVDTNEVIQAARITYTT